MTRLLRRIVAVATFALVTLFIGTDAVHAQGKIDFNRDIRPILSDKCFACHGPDTSKLKGKLRLDVRGRDVLVVDDILDTGRTLKRVLAVLRAHRPRPGCSFRALPHRTTRC